MKKTISIIALLFTISFSWAQAQTVPDKLPIGSYAELQAYAWEQAAYIGAWASTSSQIGGKGGDGRNYLWVQYTNQPVMVDGVLSTIANARCELDTLYLNWVYAQAGIYDTNGNALFQGYGGVKPNYPTGGVSYNKVDLPLALSDYIPILLPGVQWMYLVERDENGNPIRYISLDEYGAENGFRFPSYFAGKYGEIVVTTTNGAQFAYSLKGGKKIEPTHLQVEFTSVRIKGMRSYVDQTNVVMSVTGEELMEGKNPLCQLVVTKDYKKVIMNGGRPVAIDQQKVESADYFRIWFYGQPDRSLYWWVNEPLLLAPGTYWVQFHFPSGWPETSGGVKGVTQVAPATN